MKRKSIMANVLIQFDNGYVKKTNGIGYEFKAFGQSDTMHKVKINGDDNSIDRIVDCLKSEGYKPTITIITSIESNSYLKGMLSTIE
jgi:hypothetical protein